MTQNPWFFSNSTILTLILILLNVSPIFSQQRNYKEHVTIVRDEWGVPHIYGEKDCDVAYGLAWANAEDDFKTIQENILPAKGMLGMWKGKEGAVMDFVVQFLGSAEQAKLRYEKDISPEFKVYLEGYCKGLNDYAVTHPKEVKVKKAFPVTPIDAIATFHYVGALITALQDQLKDVTAGKYDTLAVTFASNAFAVNNLKSENGNPILVVNPHVKFEGLFSWYEAHLVSGEGMNVLGALFHGGTSVFVGTNEHLGWSHTWNKYDLVDTYKLKMNPKDKLQYEFALRDVFPEFAQEHPFLFRKIVMGDDLTFLHKMLDNIDKINTGELTQKDVEMALGNELADKYVYPALNAANSNVQVQAPASSNPNVFSVPLSALTNPDILNG
jgi:acyl-homoserine-lactone acylase